MINEITVLGQKVKVKFVSAKQMAKLDTNDVHGYFDIGPREIYVAKDPDKELMKRTLIHETVHAYLDISGISQIMTEQQQEGICTLLENMIDLFRDGVFLGEMEE